MKSDIANGEGVRVTVWCSGCSIHCKGCHNPETWNPDYGEGFTQKVEDKILKELEKPYIRGVTITGGNPLEKDSLPTVLNLVIDIKNHYPDKDIWLYTGEILTREDFQYDSENSTLKIWILRNCDFIVDGPFIESLKDATLPFRGSSNQRIVDVKKTLESDRIVLK